MISKVVEGRELRSNHWLLGFVFATTAVVPSLVWIALDRRVWPYDQAWYGDVSAQLFGSLYLAPRSWFGEMASLMPSKPPLVSWLGQLFIPLGMVIENLDFALLLSVVATQGLTLFLVHSLTRKLAPTDRLAALAALGLTASAPLFVGMSHQYFVEALQTLVVVGSFLLAVRARYVSLSRLVILLILVIAAGAAAKTTTAIYCGLAWLYVALEVILRLRRGERFGSLDFWHLIAAALTTILLVFTVRWYGLNIVPMLAHIRDATSSEVASQYGSVGSLPSKLIFWFQALGAAAFAQNFFGPLIIGLLIVVAALWKDPRPAVASEPAPLRVQPRFLIAAMATHVMFVLVILSLQINEETRFLEPVIPLLAVLISLAVSAISKRASSLLVAASLVQFVVVVGIALGAVPRVSQSVWLLPLVTDSTDRSVISKIADITCPSDAAYRYVIVGVEYSEMNANSMAMYSGRDRLTKGWRCNYTSLGYAETDPSRAFARIDELNASFVVLPVETQLPQDPNFLNLVVAPIFKLVSTSDRYIPIGSAVGNYQIWKRLR